MTPDPAALERHRLEQLAERDDSALADLAATPGAIWGVLFLGERFYGASLAEAAHKAATFAREVGEDAVDQLQALGVKSWPLDGQG